MRVHHSSNNIGRTADVDTIVPVSLGHATASVKPDIISHNPIFLRSVSFNKNPIPMIVGNHIAGCYRIASDGVDRGIQHMNAIETIPARGTIESNPDKVADNEVVLRERAVQINSLTRKLSAAILGDHVAMGNAL